MDISLLAVHANNIKKNKFISPAVKVIHVEANTAHCTTSPSYTEKFTARDNDYDDWE